MARREVRRGRVVGLSGKHRLTSLGARVWRRGGDEERRRKVVGEKRKIIGGEEVG